MRIEFSFRLRLYKIKKRLIFTSLCIISGEALRYYEYILDKIKFYFYEKVSKLLGTTSSKQVFKIVCCCTLRKQFMNLD